MLHYRMAEQGRFRLKDRRTPSPGTAQHHPIRLRTSVKRSVRCRRQTVGMDPKDRGPRPKPDARARFLRDLKTTFEWRGDRPNPRWAAHPTAWWADASILRRLGPARRRAGGSSAPPRPRREVPVPRQRSLVRRIRTSSQPATLHPKQWLIGARAPPTLDLVPLNIRSPDGVDDGAGWCLREGLRRDRGAGRIRPFSTGGQA